MTIVIQEGGRRWLTATALTLRTMTTEGPARAVAMRATVTMATAGTTMMVNPCYPGETMTIVIQEGGRRWVTATALTLRTMTTEGPARAVAMRATVTMGTAGTTAMRATVTMGTAG